MNHDECLLWHKRLDHTSMHTIDKISRHELVIRLLKYNFIKDKVCYKCVKKKQVIASFKSIECVSTARPSKLLHMYSCGSIRNKNLGGSKYVLVIVDDYSK